MMNMTLSNYCRILTFSAILHRKYVNYIWLNSESIIRRVADYCIIFRKIVDGRDI
jgi:hypothetical protein